MYCVDFYHFLLRPPNLLKLITTWPWWTCGAWLQISWNVPMWERWERGEWKLPKLWCFPFTKRPTAWRQDISWWLKAMYSVLNLASWPTVEGRKTECELVRKMLPPTQRYCKYLHSLALRSGIFNCTGWAFVIMQPDLAFSANIACILLADLAPSLTARLLLVA